MIMEMEMRGDGGGQINSDYTDVHGQRLSSIKDKHAQMRVGRPITEDRDNQKQL